MEDDCNIAKVKLEPEFVVCHNNDDVELAFDPFADSQCLYPVKDEPDFVDEPCFEDFNVNEVTILPAIKVDRTETVQQTDHDNFDDDNTFYQNDDDFQNNDSDFLPPLSPKIELKELHPAKGNAEYFGAQLTSEVGIKIVATNDDDLKENEKIINAAEPAEEELNTEPAVNVTKKSKVKEKTTTKKKTSVESKKKKSELKEGGGGGGGQRPPKKKGGRPKSQEEHKCAICEKVYAYASLLKLHNRTHMIDKGHNCPICGKSFARVDHCKQHVNNVHR